MLYKGDKGVSAVARSPKGAPAEAGLKSVGHGLLVNGASHSPEGGPAESGGLSLSQS